MVCDLNHTRNPEIHCPDPLADAYSSHTRSLFPVPRSLILNPEPDLPLTHASFLFGLLLVTGLGCRPVEPVILRVVSYNIRHGRGMDGEVNLERTAAVLRQLTPDIVALQEVDNGVSRSGSQDQAAVLGDLLGMHHTFGSFMDYQGGQYGMAILSRHPISRVDPVRLPEGNEPRIALAIEAELPGGRRIMVINVHFDWVSDDSYRFAQAEYLGSYLGALTSPYLLLGDFNDEPSSRTLDLFRARAIEVAKAAGSSLTFPSGVPTKEIDYLFVAPAAAWAAGVAEVIAEREASDHRPVLGIITLTPDGG